MRTGTVNLIITCALNKKYFAPWDELTPEQQAMFNDKSTQCDGLGDFGWWCIGCDFCYDRDGEEG